MAHRLFQVMVEIMGNLQPVRTIHDGDLDLEHAVIIGIEQSDQRRVTGLEQPEAAFYRAHGLLFTDIDFLILRRHGEYWIATIPGVNLCELVRARLPAVLRPLLGCVEALDHEAGLVEALKGLLQVGGRTVRPLAHRDVDLVERRLGEVLLDQRVDQGLVFSHGQFVLSQLNTLNLAEVRLGLLLTLEVQKKVGPAAVVAHGVRFQVDGVGKEFEGHVVLTVSRPEVSPKMIPV